MLLALAPQPLPLSADQDGAIRVHGTRVTLDSVVGAFKEGRTAFMAKRKPQFKGR